MSAIRRAKIYSTKKVKLEDVIPLKVPFAVHIDICSLCNLKCIFCMHSDQEAIKKAQARFGMMPYEVFTHIINDMKENWGRGECSQKIKKLRFYKIGEPLLHKDICKMVHYAKEANIAECIELTTNAILLDEKMNKGLIDAGLDILNISINGINEEQYQKVCNCQLNFAEFREHIKHFYQYSRGKCKVFIKYSDIGYTEEEKNHFYDLFEDICDEIFAEVISATLWQDTNVGDHIKDTHKGLYGQNLAGKSKQVCPFLFTTMVVNDQGIAHLCCADWKIEYRLGDLKAESVSSIWNGEKLRRYQKLHLEKKKDLIPICKNCGCLSGHTLDDIDAYAEEIAKRLF